MGWDDGEQRRRGWAAKSSDAKLFEGDPVLSREISGAVGGVERHGLVTKQSQMDQSASGRIGNREQQDFLLSPNAFA